VTNAREVEIHQFEITEIQMRVVAFKVVCSKGTYIRSLVNDFGKELNSGACLESLCRTRIGEFSLNIAYEVDDFITHLKHSDGNVKG
jgi:tRNA pseudouridine55 synthase